MSHPSSSSNYNPHVSGGSNPAAYGNSPYYSNAQQEHGSNVGVARSTQPLPQPRRLMPSLPPGVKLPPSLSSQDYNRPQGPPRTNPQAPVMSQAPNSYQAHTNAPPVNVGGAGDQSLGMQAVPVTDFVREWEEIHSENIELKNAINENNAVLDLKIKDFEKIAEENRQLSRDKDLLKVNLSTSTNRFFEARVAVLGFKCRVMQLQGDLDESRVIPKPNAPPTHQQPLQDVDAQVAALTREKRELINEKKSLELVITAERENQESLKNKKRIVEEEKQSLQDRICALEAQVQEQIAQAQNTSYQDHSMRSQMNQQLHVLQTENERLHDQIRNLSQRDTSLQSQISSLKVKEKELSGKNHELREQNNTLGDKVRALSEKQGSASPLPPVPKPRTNLQSVQVGPLQARIEKLEDDNKQLREKVSKEKELRDTVQDAYQRETTKYQDLLKKYGQFEHQQQQLQEGQGSDEMAALSEQLSALQVSEASKTQTIEQRENTIHMISREKSELQQKVANIEKRKQDEFAAFQREKLEEISTLRRAKIERDGIIADLEERMRLETTEGKTQTAMLSKSASSQTAKRLNDALGKVRELEMKVACQETDLQEDREKWEIEKRSLQGELGRLQEDNGDRLKNTEDRVQFLQSEVQRLEEHESRLVNEKLSLQEKLDRVRQDLSIKDNDHRQQTEQLRAKIGETEDLRRQYVQAQSQLDSEKQEKEKKTGKLVEIQKQFSDTKKDLNQTQSRINQVEAEKRRLEAERTDLDMSLRHLTGVKEQLSVEKQTLEATCSEFKQETTSLLQDYEVCAQRLKTAEAERDHFKGQYKQMQADIAQKTDRIAQVEAQRKSVQDSLAHMDAQLKIYQEDFERERQAREAAVKVKNLAEERMAKKEKEVKELRERLNQQTAHTLSEDQYDEPSEPSQGSNPSTGYMNPPATNRHPSTGSSLRTLSPSPSHGRSGEQTQGGDFGRRSQEQQRYPSPEQRYGGAPGNQPGGGLGNQPGGGLGNQPGGGPGNQPGGGPGNQPGGGPGNQPGGGHGNQLYGGPGNQAIGGPRNQPFGGPGNQPGGGHGNQPFGGPGNQPMGHQGFPHSPPSNKRPPPTNKDINAPPIPPRDRLQPQQGYPQPGHGDQAWTQQIPSQVSRTPTPRARPMTTAQEPATAGGGDLARAFQQPRHIQQPGGMQGGYAPQHQQPQQSLHQGQGQSMHSQQSLHPQQQGHIQQQRQGSTNPPNNAARRPSSAESRRNDLSMPQARNNLDMPGGAAGGQSRPPPQIGGGGGYNQHHGMEFRGGVWVGPGEVVNQAPPSMACPICGLQNFSTQTDLELHCAQCT